MQRMLTMPLAPDASVTTYSIGPPISNFLALTNRMPPELMFRVAPTADVRSVPVRMTSTGSSSSNRLVLRCSITLLNLDRFH